MGLAPGCVFVCMGGGGAVGCCSAGAATKQRPRVCRSRRRGCTTEALTVSPLLLQAVVHEGWGQHQAVLQEGTRGGGGRHHQVVAALHGHDWAAAE
jgi:hypothetical protein